LAEVACCSSAVACVCMCRRSFSVQKRMYVISAWPGITFIPRVYILSLALRLSFVPTCRTIVPPSRCQCAVELRPWQVPLSNVDLAAPGRPGGFVGVRRARSGRCLPPHPSLSSAMSAMLYPAMHGFSGRCSHGRAPFRLSLSRGAARGERVGLSTIGERVVGSGRWGGWRRGKGEGDVVYDMWILGFPALARRNT